MGNMEPLTKVDAAWLGMENPTNLMMVSGILTFDEPVDFETLKQVIQNRLLQHRRFRQCVRQPRNPISAPYWEDDANFDINSHMHRVALPVPGDKAALETMVGDLMSTPLDFSKPLWSLHLIENYGDGCAIMTRLHHCIADGMALVMVLLSMTDFAPNAPQPKRPPVEEDAKDASPGPIGALFKQASSTVKSVRKITKRVLSEGVESILNPAHALELALKGSDHAYAAGRLVLRSPDPQTIFKGELGVAKRGVWSRPLSLKDVKLIKNVTGSTVNDVLVSAITGGLRRYMISRNAEVEGVNFRAAIPVNLRKPDEMATLGNRFGIIYLSLPIGIEEPLERLAEVRRRMLALKGSEEAVASFGILNVIGMSPNDVQEEMVKMFASKATTVLTNVPGPPMPLYLAGGKISGLMFWVPQSGRVSFGISIISYAGKVFLGVVADMGLIPDPETIIDGFYEEYDALLTLANEAKAIAEAEAQSEANVPAKAASHTTNLQSVKGIGPKFEERLQAAGIVSVEKLGETAVSDLATALNISPSRAQNILTAAKK